MIGLAGGDFGIERIDAAGLDAHQHLAGAGDRTGNGGQCQRRAGGTQNQGLHRYGMDIHVHDRFPLKVDFGPDSVNRCFAV